jgi:hypothetical protein
VARFWCPRAGASVSILPAFLAARMSGTLDAVEAAVLAVEQTGSIATAVEHVHPAEAERAIGAICAQRSLRRRLRGTRHRLHVPRARCCSVSTANASTLGASHMLLSTLPARRDAPPRALFAAASCRPPRQRVSLWVEH